MVVMGKKTAVDILQALLSAAADQEGKEITKVKITRKEEKPNEKSA